MPKKKQLELRRAAENHTGSLERCFKSSESWKSFCVHSWTDCLIVIRRRSITTSYLFFYIISSNFSLLVPMKRRGVEHHEEVFWGRCGVGWRTSLGCLNPLTAGLRQPGQGQQTAFVFQQIWYQGSCSPHNPPYIPPLHTYTTPSTSLLAKHPLQPGDPSPPTSLTEYFNFTVFFTTDQVRRQLRRFYADNAAGLMVSSPKGSKRVSSPCLHSQSPEGPCAVEGVVPCSCAYDAPSQKLLWLQTSGADVPHHEYPGETDTGTAPAHA